MVDPTEKLPTLWLKNKNSPRMREKGVDEVAEEMSSDLPVLLHGQVNRGYSPYLCGFW